jgi:hypothetical protein
LYFCKDKFKIYYEKLTKNGIDLLKDKTSNFKLRTNLGIYKIDLGDGTSISISDAQDDICLRFLKENPNRIEMFESFQLID